MNLSDLSSDLKRMRVKATETINLLEGLKKIIITKGNKNTCKSTVTTMIEKTIERIN